MRAVLFLVGLGAVLIGSFVARAADVPKCAAPAELIADDPRFPAIGEAFAAHQPVTIVAIGGASTAGIAPDNSYPYFLEAALKARHPGTAITVLNRGVAGQTADEMAARFAKDVFPARPNLVIWETGTVDAVRSGDIDAFAQTLSDGAADIAAHHAYAMFMDMQYNPGTVSVINFEPYLDALKSTAQLEDVYFFRRFEIMQYWSDAGAFDFEDASREKRASLAREVYECLGERLADAIDSAAH